MTKIEKLNLLSEKVASCTKCQQLCENRKTTVFGEGNQNSKIIFLGECPGTTEDEQGKPFVGPAGQLLMEIIRACGWKREDVYILNVLKCKTPNNRRPTEKEAANCWNYLELQIKIVNPKYIVCLGATAAQTLLSRPWQSISSLRGLVHHWQDKKVICTYHPSFILHAKTEEKANEIKRLVWQDFQLLMQEMKNENH